MLCFVYFTCIIFSFFTPFLSLPQWMCQFCTFVNTKPTLVCEMCNLSCKDSTGVSLPHSLQQTPSITKDQPQPGVKPQPMPRLNPELRRQAKMREDGLNLIHQIRVGQHGNIFQSQVPEARGEVSKCFALSDRRPVYHQIRQKILTKSLNWGMFGIFGLKMT